MPFFDSYQTGHLVLPSNLLFHYRDIFDNSDDFLVWQFIYLQNTTSLDELAPSQIAKAIGRDLAEVNRSISNLTAKELLVVKTIELAGEMEIIFDASPAFAKLEILLQSEQVKPQSAPNAFKALVADFEGELGRFLSPFELEDLQKTLEEGTDPELVRAALKEAVLNGKVNLKYIAAILRNWRQEGVVTMRQVAERRRQREAANPKAVDVSAELAQAMTLWSDQ